MREQGKNKRNKTRLQMQQKKHQQEALVVAAAVDDDECRKVKREK